MPHGCSRHEPRRNHHQRVNTQRQNTALLSPLLDVMLAGGFALICLLALVIFIPAEKQTGEQVMSAGVIAGVMYLLSYFVNYPHFMASYQLFYRRFGARLSAMREFPGMRARYLSAGIIVPLLLCALLIAAVWQAGRGDLSWVAASLHIMFFFVGWHYCKQAFGVFIMLSAVQKIFYAPSARKVLLMNAYTVWLTSWVYMSYTSKYLGVAFQQGFIGSGNRFGYSAIEIPDIIRIPLLCAALITTALSAWVLFAHWRNTRIAPPLSALMGYTSMYYLWAFVAVLHPEWALAAPFFHSLQYLMFVAAYKHGEVQTTYKAQPTLTEKEKKRLKARAQEFFGIAFVLGILAFNVIPYQLHNQLAADMPGLLPTGLMVLAFSVFINVHHYFIDNVLWRKENREVGQNLLGWRT